MRKWKVLYDSGVYAGSLEDAPGDGVVVIVQEDDDVGREILHRKDFYYWERGRWWGCDLYGLFDYLRRPGWKKVLAGRNVEHRTYHALMDQARLDMDFSPKTALLTGELPG